MFSSEFFELLKDIVKSWQVIAVTIVLALYLYIVSYVSRTYHRPRMVKKVKVKTKKAEPVAESGPEEIESDSNDELGLEEA
jgi:hypothetical protein